LKPARDTDFIRRRAPTLWIIILIKLGKALLLLLLAVGFFQLIGKDVGDTFDHLLRLVKLDPSSKFFAKLGDRLDTVTPTNLKWLASGSLLYAILLIVECAGLMRRSWWAVWFAIGETAFFIPLELFELVGKFSWPMFGLFVVNSLIVAYLVVNRQKLFHHHHAKSRDAAKAH
jgi:uncharacterized membrane protein (DUF2068 family)